MVSPWNLCAPRQSFSTPHLHAILYFSCGVTSTIALGTDLWSSVPWSTLSTFTLTMEPMSSALTIFPLDLACTYFLIKLPLIFLKVHFFLVYRPWEQLLSSILCRGRMMEFHLGHQCCHNGSKTLTFSPYASKCAHYVQHTLCNRSNTTGHTDSHSMLCTMLC